MANSEFFLRFCAALKFKFRGVLRFLLRCVKDLKKRKNFWVYGNGKMLFFEWVCAIFFFGLCFPRYSSRGIWGVRVAELGWVYYRRNQLSPVLVVYPPTRSVPYCRIRSPMDYNLKVVCNSSSVRTLFPYQTELACKSSVVVVWAQLHLCRRRCSSYLPPKR